MSNTITLNPGVGGPSLGVDNVSGTVYEIVKIGFSDAGVSPVQVALDNPLPVTVTNGVSAVSDGSAFTEGTGLTLGIAGIANEVTVGTLTELTVGLPRVTYYRELRTVAHEESGVVVFNGVPYTVAYAAISASASGTNAIVGAVAGNIIRVLSVDLSAAGAVNASFQSGSTNITGLTYFAAAGASLVRPYSPHGWFQTAVGAALNLNLSAAVAVGGSVAYIVVP